jgi:signal transduction histidine kinase
MQVSGRLPRPVEVAAYYVVSEALTNAAKHAEASAIEIDFAMISDYLHLRVRDDGVGGADATRGSGLTGLMDRVAAVGGRMGINSPAHGGTTVLVTLPLTSS